MRAFAQAVACELVLTQPERPAGRGQRLRPTPVALAARELGLATLAATRWREAFEALRATDADLFAVASYGKIVPQAILELPPLGALNVHPSLLPRYRGATPLQAQLRDGVTRSGVTIIAMDAGMDTGDIVLQEESTIGAAETYGELHDRFASLGAELLARACAQAAAGSLRRIPQAGRASEEEIARTLTHPLTKDALRIEWSAAAKRIVDLVRSLSPSPAARGILPGTAIPAKILQAHEPGPRRPLAPGELAVACGAHGEQQVVIDRLVPANRKPMNGTDYLAGLRS